MDSLITAMEGMVEDLYGHVHRVSAVAAAIGRTMGLAGRDVDRLATVGVLHDIGKVHVDPAILAKPGPLVGEEIVRMRRHPEFGFAMTVELFDEAIAEAILYHHERFDGEGYPYGLKAHEIPLLARIVLVADAFDAITSHRSYQPALSAAYAVEEIRAHSGTQFDPGVVDAFLHLVESGSLVPTAVGVPHGIAAR
jgi:HD-GYP domain-containing protein (c-di-GMP phosphodiesterase class II)